VVTIEHINQEQCEELGPLPKYPNTSRRPGVNSKLDDDRIQRDLPSELVVEPEGEVWSSRQCILQACSV
jgi:hypothetical protein